MLYITINWLVPIVAPALLEGMLQWSIPTIVFTWLIQYGFIYASIELKETLVKRSYHWIIQLHRSFVRWVLLVINLLVFFIFISAVWLLFKIIDQYSLGVVVEMILLFIQVWVCCRVAAPMSGRRYFFSVPRKEYGRWQMSDGRWQI